MGLARKLAALRGMDAAEVKLMLRASLILLRVRIKLAHTSVEKLIHSEGGRAYPSGVPGGSCPSLPVRRAIHRAEQLLPVPMTCLVRAIATARLAREFGEASVLAIGMRGEDFRLKGHAWVLGSESNPDYVALAYWAF